MDGIRSLWFSSIHLSHDLRQQLQTDGYMTGRAMGRYHTSFQTERSRVRRESPDLFMEEYR
jgi:hypothetical protein